MAEVTSVTVLPVAMVLLPHVAVVRVADETVIPLQVVTFVPLI